jgi:hypothetical protein
VYIDHFRNRGSPCPRFEMIDLQPVVSGLIPESVNELQ